MSTALKECSVCESEFLVKRPGQIKRDGGEMMYFCSEECRKENRSDRGAHVCSVCQEEFVPKYAYQRGREDGEVVYFCSMECRRPVATGRRRQHNRQKKGAMKIAILNQKGGTGKTTTSVSLAAGLAEEGHSVLLIDLDSQGHIGVSLGVEGDATLHDVLVDDRPVEECVVGARPNLDILPGDESLAEAEVYLTRMNGQSDRLLRQRLQEELDYDFVLIDCGPSLSFLNKNALTFAEHLLVPVACDFLSLVGVKQVMQTLKKVNSALVNPIDILGILPTFYDVRNNISDESIKTLKSHFHNKVLPPIRVNTRLKEAPSENETIFEYAPSSRGAKDYQRVVDWLVEQQEERLRAG
jgi:chromosome partitioning protein